MYADDLLLFATSADSLQHLLGTVTDHFNKWLMTINYSKTQVMIFDKQSARYKSTVASTSFTINTRQITVVESCKYLGVTFTHKCNFKLHQSIIIERAQRRLHQINWMRRSGTLLNVQSSIESYQMLVQSIIEQSAHVCHYGRNDG